MEEIVTVDGKQYKLTYDSPLTAQQKTQAIADIRKQSCRTCGTKTARPVRTMNWKYRGVKSLQEGTGASSATGACLEGPIGSEEMVTLNAAPMEGVAPYIVQFSKQIGCTIESVADAEINVDEAPDAETPTTTPVEYTLTDADVADSLGCEAKDGVASPLATVPNAPVSISLPALDSGFIRFISALTDSCPSTSGGPGYCVQHCDVALVCAAPTCNFIVS